MLKNFCRSPANVFVLYISGYVGKLNWNLTILVTIKTYILNVQREKSILHFFQVKSVF